MNSNSKMIFSDNLKMLMKSKGISRKQLSSDIGVKYTTLTDWINGKTYPRIDKIDLLAEYFGISKSELIERGLVNNEYLSQNSRTNDLAVFIEQNIDDMTFNGKLLDYNEKIKLKLILMLVFNNSYTDLELDQMLSIITNKQRK
ncbi:helix-turn-helix transcriptional regulator [Campylobacter jejuni]|nr:helix-turn-helix transcriptional regulator [Campylobacter jejuni]